MPERDRLRLVAVLPLVVLAAVAGLVWNASRLPAAYGIGAMGTADWGSGPAATHLHGNGISISILVEQRPGPPDVSYDLTARVAQVTAV